MAQLGWLAVVLGVVGTACGGVQARREELGRALGAYHEFMRWKKFEQAALFHSPETQSDFAARYAAAEDDLHVESMEVRSIALAPEVEDQPLTAQVVVVAQAYLLPSTVLEKIVLQQRWELREGRWLMVSSSRELVPALEPKAAAPGALEPHALDGSPLDPASPGAESAAGAPAR